MEIKVLSGTTADIKRGYVKWTSPDGEFHKEELAAHPELLADATPAQQLAAEEARRLNLDAASFVAALVVDTHEVEDTLAELKAAPASVLTAAELSEEIDSTDLLTPELTDDDRHE